MSFSRGNEPANWRRYRLNGEPQYMKLRFIFHVVGSPDWPIHIWADDEDAHAIVPITILEGNVSEAAAPPQPVLPNERVEVHADVQNGGERVNVTELVWNVGFRDSCFMD
ncbi:hypothetical protein ACJIZ3_003638 [Penstemon smallii]|uniref:CARDB domain-containing protein n=1 Tax=Penstemon smallii TaxID=265156 RepID=A0ABD3UCW4_9LAMI